MLSSLNVSNITNVKLHDIILKENMLVTSYKKYVGKTSIEKSPYILYIYMYICQNLYFLSQ